MPLVITPPFHEYAKVPFRPARCPPVPVIVAVPDVDAVCPRIATIPFGSENVNPSPLEPVNVKLRFEIVPVESKLMTPLVENAPKGDNVPVPVRVSGPPGTTTAGPVADKDIAV